MPRHREIRLGGSLEHPDTWRRILRGWRGLLSDFAAQGEDLPFWYSERANVSALAGACWRSWPSSLVIAEPGVHRATEATRVKGRQDLWLRLPHFAVDLEAKQVWPATPTPDGRTVGNVEDALKRATEQLRSARKADRDQVSDVQVAAAFAVPWMLRPDGWAASDLRRHVHRLSDLLWARLGSARGGRTFQASFALSDDGMKTFYGEGDDGGRIAPGVILHGRVV